MPSASHGNKHQHDHHRNGDEAAAAAAVSPATAAIVVVSAAATAAGRAAEVAVEGRHVLGIARGALAEIAVITVCHCIFLHPKCVLLLFLSLFYQERCPIKIPFRKLVHLFPAPLPVVLCGMSNEKCLRVTGTARANIRRERQAAIA